MVRNDRGQTEALRRFRSGQRFISGDLTQVEPSREVGSTGGQSLVGGGARTAAPPVIRGQTQARAVETASVSGLTPSQTVSSVVGGQSLVGGGVRTAAPPTISSRIIGEVTRGGPSKIESGPSPLITMAGGVTVPNVKAISEAFTGRGPSILELASIQLGRTVSSSRQDLIRLESTGRSTFLQQPRKIGLGASSLIITTTVGLGQISRDPKSVGVGVGDLISRFSKGERFPEAGIALRQDPTFFLTQEALTSAAIFPFRAGARGLLREQRVTESLFQAQTGSFRNILPLERFGGPFSLRTAQSELTFTPEGVISGRQTRLSPLTGAESTRLSEQARFISPSLGIQRIEDISRVVRTGLDVQQRGLVDFGLGFGRETTPIGSEIRFFTPPRGRQTRLPNFAAFLQEPRLREVRPPTVQESIQSISQQIEQIPGRRSLGLRERVPFRGRKGQIGITREVPPELLRDQFEDFDSLRRTAGRRTRVLDIEDIIRTPRQRQIIRPRISSLLLQTPQLLGVGLPLSIAPLLRQQPLRVSPFSGLSQPIKPIQREIQEPIQRLNLDFSEPGEPFFPIGGDFDFNIPGIEPERGRGRTPRTIPFLPGGTGGFGLTGRGRRASRIFAPSPTILQRELNIGFRRLTAGTGFELAR